MGGEYGDTGGGVGGAGVYTYKRKVREYRVYMERESVNSTHVL